MGRVANIAIWAGSSAVGAFVAVGFALWLKGFGEPWIGFAGGVAGGAIGGIMTVAAGYLAWRGVREQNELTRQIIADRARDEGLADRISVGEAKKYGDVAAEYALKVDKLLGDGYAFEALRAQVDTVIVFTERCLETPTHRVKDQTRSTAGAVMAARRAFSDTITGAQADVPALRDAGRALAGQLHRHLEALNQHHSAASR